MPLYTEDPFVPMDAPRKRAAHDLRLHRGLGLYIRLKEWKAMTTYLKKKPMNTPNTIGRKIVYIDEEAVLRQFCRKWEDTDCIRVPQLDLPETAVVEYVFMDYARRAFGFVVADPSFEDTGPCIQLPSVRVEWKYVKLEKKRPPEVNKPWVEHYAD